MTRLACDAWLLPTDDRLDVTDAWDGAYDASALTRMRTRQPWGPHERVRLLSNGNDNVPQVWLGNIGADNQSASWYAQGAAAFVREAAPTLAARPTSDRPPLLALPHVGTGAGGARETKGDVLEALFGELYAALGEEGIRADVVLVSWDEPGHAAAQRARARALGGTESDLSRVVQGWPFHDRSRARGLGMRARSLAQACNRGQLAVFMGAGVSVGAGLPSWTDLLMKVAGRLPKSSRASTVAALPKLSDPRDKAELLERRFRAEGTTLARQLKPHFRKHPRFSLQHGLLSSLPVREFTTTNFDELFEAAARTGNRGLRVIGAPGTAERRRDAGRWLLKLHGTVSRPETVVLTRSSYFDAPRQRGALFGLVQAMLMTRHMLFVGYGLGDEDFHELVHEVRLAREPTFRMRDAGPRRSATTQGTAITLWDDPVHAEVWKGDVKVVAMLPSAKDGIPPATDPGREVELFLDLLGLLAADRTAFLLDPQYAGMLTEDEKELAGALGRLGLEDFTDTRDGWSEVYALLKRFGQPDHTRQKQGIRRGRSPSDQ